jgi:tRNA(Ile)-lysidine synthase
MRPDRFIATEIRPIAVISMTATPVFLAKLAEAWPSEQWRDVTVLVAVSGGADSVALLRGLSQLRVTGEGRLVVAHFNHKLRGAESDVDQEFVESLAREVGLEYALGAAAESLHASHGGQGLEGAAREARYEFLAQVADQYGARYVATAHTADDHVETVLFNLIRGTGLAGLAGIPRVRQLTEGATLIRPLLCVSRDEVLEYLNLLGKTWREDETNKTLDFTRNRIRHELLPLLERDFNPHVREALCRLSAIAGDADEFMLRFVGQLMDQVTRAIPGGIELHLKPLRHLSDVTGRYALMHVWRHQGWPLGDMSYEKWQQLYDFALALGDPNDRQPARQSFPGGVMAIRQGGILRLLRPNAGDRGN